MNKEDDYCVIEFKKKEDVKSAVKLLKSISKDVQESCDTATYEKILNEVRKNP